MIKKLCSKCKTEKTVDNFSFRNKSKGVFHSACRPCRYYEDNYYDLCECGEKKRNSSKFCKECRKTKGKQFAIYHSATIGDKNYDKSHKSKLNLIRFYARKTGIELGFTKCINCEYDKCFEICHIKSVSSFPPETLLTTINDKSNLIPLCPNCHWEFDHGIIQI